MEINNILDALSMEDVTEIIQLCSCKYDGKEINFRLINDDIGIIDEIEYEEGSEWLNISDISDNSDDLMLKAIKKAPFEVFHKSDVGATLKLNHESIKPQNISEHFKTEFYVDDEEGPIVFTLNKNIVKLEN